MKNTKKLFGSMIVLGVIELVLLCNVVCAIEYYVDRYNGDDANVGTSWDTAFKTINAAASVAKAGDIVFVNQGVYTEEIKLKSKGMSDKERLVFKAVGEVIIEGLSMGFNIDFQRNPTPPPYPYSAMYITIDGFIFRGLEGYYKGIVCTQYSVGNIFRNLRFENCATGIYMSGSAQNVVEKCVFIGCTKGIHFLHTTGGDIVKNSLFVKCGSGIYLERDFSPIKVVNSIFYSNTKGIGLGYYTPLYGNAKIDYCNFWGNTIDYEGTKIVLGENNIALDPQFLNAKSNLYYLKPTSPCLKAGTAENGEFQNIGPYGIGRLSSWNADSWSGWVDQNGSPVTESVLVELDTNGNIKLKDGVTSAAVRSPVIDTQKDTGKIKSINFVATEYPELESGSRQVIDYNVWTVTREIRWRGSSSIFSVTDILPEWQQAFKISEISVPANHRYLQIELTLRLNAK